MFQQSNIEGESLSDLVQIAGLVRFSYPCTGGFRRAYATPAAQVEALFSEARMQERFRYFEALCLHSLKAQTDKGFSIGVLIGEAMPAAYQERLKKLLTQLPQARLITLPVLPYEQAMTLAYAQLFGADAPLRLSFRLDDDDAVAVDFIAEVRAKLPQICGMSGALDPVGLSFLKGLTLFGPKGNRHLVPAIDARPLGLGLCVMAPSQRQVNALRFSHEKLHQNMPMIMDPCPMMNLRAFHNSNDSVVALPAGRGLAMSQTEIRQILQRRFSLDMDRVLAL